MKELHTLEGLGLRDYEVKVYLELLKTGPSSIRTIAAASGVNRGLAYEALKRLVEIGLVGAYRKGERNKYFAESPERIHDLLAEKKRDLSQVQEQVNDLVPKLMAQSHQRLGEPIMRFYEDDEGVVAILRDVLNTAAKLPTKEYYVYSSRQLRQYVYRRFPNFTRRRISEGIFVRAIAVGEGGDPVEHAERRWLPEPMRERFTSYTLIYGDKVAMISVSPDDTPYGVIIEEPGVAAMQRFLFEQLWNSITPPNKL